MPTQKSQTSNHSWKFCVAPMMECTDRHDRFLLRLVSKHALLYTEMLTTQALINGDRNHLLGFLPFAGTRSGFSLSPGSSPGLRRNDVPVYKMLFQKHALSTVIALFGITARRIFDHREVVVVTRKSCLHRL